MAAHGLTRQFCDVLELHFWSKVHTKAALLTPIAQSCDSHHYNAQLKGDVLSKMCRPRVNSSHTGAPAGNGQAEVGPVPKHT